MSSDIVYLHCIKLGSKLRVRIISPGYHNEANCQFPRNIREPGRYYSVPKSDVSFVKGPRGKFFYRVNKQNIRTVCPTVLPNEITKHCESEAKSERKIVRIYESGGGICLVCMENPYDVVLIPCGHYCLCSVCAYKLFKSGKCPLCRGNIEDVAIKAMISI
jgi:hypothetical protein